MGSTWAMRFFGVGPWYDMPRNIQKPMAGTIFVDGHRWDFQSIFTVSFLVGGWEHVLFFYILGMS